MSSTSSVAAISLISWSAQRAGFVILESLLLSALTRVSITSFDGISLTIFASAYLALSPVVSGR